MNDEKKIGYEQYWGLPKDISEWSTKAIAELVSLGYEMSDQGEPIYEAYALGMVAIIAELRTINKMLADMMEIQTQLLQFQESERTQRTSIGKKQEPI